MLWTTVDPYPAVDTLYARDLVQAFTYAIAGGSMSQTEDKCHYKVMLMQKRSQRQGPRGFALTWNAWAHFLLLASRFGQAEWMDLLCHGGKVTARDAEAMAQALGRASSIEDPEPWLQELRLFIREGAFLAEVNH